MYPPVTKELMAYFGEETLIKVMNENPSCRGVMFGYVAEAKLKEQLDTIPEIRSVTKIPDHSPVKGDFLVVFEDDSSCTIEVKMIRSANFECDPVNGGIGGKVGVKSSDAKLLPGTNTRTSTMKYGAFDILAVAFMEGGIWKFRFMKEKWIPSSPNYPGRMATSFAVHTEDSPFLYPDLSSAIFDEVFDVIVDDKFDDVVEEANSLYPSVFSSDFDIS